MKYKIGIKDKKFDVEVGEIQNGLAQVTVDQKAYQVTIENYAEQMPAKSAPKAAPAPKPAPVMAPKPAAAPVSADSNVIRAPIPGLVLAVKVNVGDAISAGQVVAILEAMKMENSITSSISGTVKEIRTPKGTEVANGDIIMVIG